MALPTADVIEILGDNLRLRGSVLPISSRRATRWTRGLGLPRGGETVLYTGQMYQLIPYIEGLVRAESRLGETPLARLTGLGRRINKLVNVSAFMTRPSRAEREEFDRVPRAVVRLLRDAGVAFGSLYEDDLYSGTLAHDLGLDELVAAHARRVYEIFRKHGVRTVITIDPHTTNMLRSVYPQLLEDYDVEVKSYLEVLAERDGSRQAPPAGDAVIHDSCVFARYEGVVDEPRALLARAGVTVVEPGSSGRLTWCCGGPVEALYPEKALAQAERRVAQLRAAGTTCVTMCPLCLVNLSKAAGGTVAFHDISEVLLAASERAAGRPAPTL
ncbi:MAG TPA: (Fe-S)-binding protein [Gaiellaceae bacterium]|nr:(Fe-S)-binding protein [Gaiellaceae bacterium]